MSNAPISPLLPVYKRAAVTFERGEGCYLFDQDGRRYLDFGCGVAVTQLGHGHPHLVAALRAQGEKLWHCSNLYHNEPAQRFAERLVAHSFADTAFFCNSGTEALECAIKMARRYHYHHGEPERFRLITFEGAFHGRTMAPLSAAGQARHLEGFTPALDGFDLVPLGDLAAVEAAIGPHTGGVLIEPIQGEGGIRAPGAAFLEELRALCDDHRLLLIFDEVQSGIGRMGPLFGYQTTSITPDIMTLAKGLGGGFPLGACLATARAAAGMTAGSHGSTFGGNPLACAVGNAVLDVLLGDDFLDQAQAVGATLHARLEALQTAFPNLIAEIRGTGLFYGLRLAEPALNADLVAHLLAAGLVTVPAAENVVRLLPPLIVAEQQVDEALAALEEGCRALQREEAA